MQGGRRSRSIRGQLLILSLGLVSFMVVVQVGLYVRLRTVLLERSEATAETVLLQANRSIAESIGASTGVALRTAQYSLVQRYLLTESASDRFELYGSVRTLLRSYLDSNLRIDFIAIRQGTRILLSETTATVPGLFLTSRFYDTLDRYPSADRDIGRIWSVSFPEINEAWFLFRAPVYNTSPGFDPFDVIGDVFVAGALTDFGDVLESALNAPLDFISLATVDGQLLLSAGAKPLEMVRPLATEAAPSSTSVKIEGVRYIQTQHPVDATPWMLLSLVSTRAAQRELEPIRTFGIVSGAAALVAAIAYALALIRSIIGPIDEIVHFVASIEATTDPRRLRLPTPNELAVVSEQLNRMLDRIQEMTTAKEHSQRRLHDLQLARKQAELSALEMQVHPHFLYNTLDCIRSIGYGYGAAEVVTVSTALAEILRYIIKAPETVALRDELGCIAKYMQIMSIRFPDRFAIEVDVTPELLSVPVLKMTLQPVVENAIYHGLEPRRGRGTVTIRARTCANTLELHVADDGLGFEPNRLAAIQESLARVRRGEATEAAQSTGGIGILNIHERITLTHGPNFGVDVRSLESGTLVTVTFPCPPSGTAPVGSAPHGSPATPESEGGSPSG